MGSIKERRENHHDQSDVSPSFHVIRPDRACFQDGGWLPRTCRNAGPWTNLDISDETEITSVYAADADDVNDAVAAARQAFRDPSWRDMPTAERADLLFKLASLIEAHRETLATIETWDNGACRAQL